MSDDKPKPGRRLVRGLRWGLRWTLRLGGGLLLVVLGVLAFVMLTGAGTRWVLGTGVRTYDNMIPGSIRVAEIGGTLVRGITLDGVVLEDASGHTLISAERVTLALSWMALAGQHVEVEDLSLAGVVVDLPTDGAGFGDLAPPPSDEPQSPSETIGPDLPVRISGAVDVEDVQVVQAGEVLVSVGSLELELDAHGTEAQLSVAGALEVPVAALDVPSIALQARWTEPAVVLEALAIETNRGSVQLDRIEADVADHSGRLDGLRIVAAGPAWSELTGLDASLAPTITFDAEGSTAELVGELVADLGDGGKATLRLSGGLQPDLELHAELDVATRLETFVPELAPRPIVLDTALDLRGALDGVVSAELDLTCRGCGEGDRPVRLRVGAEAVNTRLRGPDEPAWVALADLDLLYEGTTLAIEGGLAPDGTASARVELPVTALDALGRAAAGYAELPALRGNADAELDCYAELSAPTIVCVVDAGIDEGAPVKLARVQATVATTGLDALLADIRDLRVSAQGADVRLLGGGAAVRLDERALVVEGLGLRLSTATGVGTMTVGGALRDAREGTLTARLADVDLGLVRTFVPELAIGGRLDGTVRVSGTPAAPRVTTSLQTDGLSVAGWTIGNIDLDGGYRDESVSANVDLEGGDIGRWTLAASADAALTLDPPGFEPRLSRPIRLELEARDLALETVARKVDGAPALSGTMGVDISLRGNAARPRIQANVKVAKLALDRHLVGELAVAADYEGGRTKVTSTLAHPRVESLKLEAEAPIRLTLDRPPRWNRAGDHEVSLQVRKAQLAAANDFADVRLGGTVDLDVAMTGSARAPELELLASLDGAAFEGREVATGALRVGYAGDELEATADLRGPAFAGLGLQAKVPLSVSASGARWHADREHLVSVALVGVSLFEAASWTREPLDVGGHLDATVDLRGAPADPVVTATVDARRVTYGGREVGDVEVDASYQAQVVKAQLDWVHDPLRRATVRVSVPVRFDADARAVQWRADAPHQLRVDIPRIDRDLLEPFVELPEDADFATSCVVLLDGGMQDFALSAALRGHARSPEGQLARVNVDVDADPRRQSLAVSLGSSVTATLSTKADVAALAAKTVALGDVPVEGHVVIDALPLGFLAELAPEDLYNVQGQLDVDATVVGTPNEPKLDGWAELSSGAMTLVALRQRLTGMSAKVDFSNDEVVLERFATSSGAGRVVGKGAVSVRSGRAKGALDLDLEQMPAQSPGLPRLEVTSKISAELEASPERARVDVSLTGSRVDVLTSSVEAAKAIPSSANVRFVGSLDQPERPESVAVSRVDPVPWLVRVEMAEPLRIVGPAVDMSWGGSIVAQSDGGAVRTSGALASTEGFIELLSNRFDIERGTVTFAEGDEVQLFADLLASSRIGEVDVSAEIRGPLPRPELRLSSVPSLTESQIFTVMLTGEADVDSLDPEEAQAQAASLLAAVSSPALQRQLNDRLKVDRIGVGVGETTRDPILTVGKNVSRRVYAETQYRHNAPINNNRAELRVRYRFAPRWSLETFFGDAAAGGLAIFWTRTFDSKRK